jgi:hypothetical protein
MIALQIENIKEFMVQLFQGEMFDKFCVSGCEVTTFTRFTSDCRQNSDWYDVDEKEEDSSGLVSWKQLKPVMFSLIKGKKTPSNMNIDFCFYMPDGDMGSLRIQYEADKLLVFTGYMQREFSMDKSKQQSWDENCIQFIKKNNIVSTRLE